MSKRDLSEADKRAWQAAVRHVRPLSQNAAALGGETTAGPRLTSPQPPVLAKRKQAVQSPQYRANDKRVRRGKQPVSSSFDLHGHTQQSAWQALPAFLAREQAKGAQCVIVITGKGRSGEGVLRRNFLLWLELPEAHQYVSGYAPAHARHGGSGAWYVFLRRRT